MNPLEIAAALAGIVNLALLVRRNVWNYPFGIVSVALLIPVFAGARLYSNAVLQVFFVAVQLYGWWAWARASDGDTVPVTRLTIPARTAWTLALVLLTLLWGATVGQRSGAIYPFWDAAQLVMSVAAQIALTRRLIENWWLWIAIDVIALWLYPAGGLPIVALLYAAYLVMSVIGLVEWLRAARREALA